MSSGFTKRASAQTNNENGISTPFRPLEKWDDDTDRRRAMKTNIRNVLDSYQGTYDFIAEMVQNAIDEVEFTMRLHEAESSEADVNAVATYTPSIWIIVDAQNNKVSVLDNGMGMDLEQIQRFVYPSYTEKQKQSRLIKHALRGHKGVGSTYLAYGFNHIQVSTKGFDGPLSMCLEGGRQWTLSNDNLPEPLAKPSGENIALFRALAQGTVVTICLDDSTQPASLSRLGSSAERWALILRTCTALGFIDIREEQRWQEKLSINLIYIDKDGDATDVEVSPSYIFPHSIDGFDWLDLGRFYREHRETVDVPRNCRDNHGVFRVWSKDDLIQPKTGLARGLGFNELLACEPTVYAAFTHSSRLWDALTEALTNDKRLKVMRPGVWVVDSNAVTGRSIAVEPAYGAGNVERLHMLVDLRGVRPDLGRKGFNPILEEQIRKLAENALSYFIARRKGFLKPAGVEPGESHRRLDLYRKLKKAEERLEKQPLDVGLSVGVIPENEPEVIEIFGELRGLGVIVGYCLIGGFHSDVYDLALRYRVCKGYTGIIYDRERNPLGVTKAAFGNHDSLERPPFLGEYKVSLDGLVEELVCREEAKSFDELDLVITWECGTKWQKEFDLVEFGKDLSVSKRELFGTTHLLSRKGINDGHTIAVIELKNIVDLIRHGAVGIHRSEGP